MFTNPLEKLPRDGERVQFKVIGDPKVHDVKEPTLGKFVAPSSTQKEVSPTLIGWFIDEETGNPLSVWNDGISEVALWRPIDEFHKELQ